MRYCLIAGMALLLAAANDSAALGAKRSKSRRGNEDSAKSEIEMPPVCGAKQKKSRGSGQCGGCSTNAGGCGNQCGESAGGCGSSQCGGCNPCCGAGMVESIDIDSLTPVAQSKMLFEKSQARIMFELPEDVDVFLLNRKMSTPGAKRSFVVPVPDAQRTYDYAIRVDAVRGGKKYYKKLKVSEFRAGMILVVKVESPKVEDGQPVVLKAEAKVEAAGGPPKVKEDDGEKKDDGNIITTQIVR